MKEMGSAGTYLYIRNYVNCKILQLCSVSEIWIEKIAYCLVRRECMECIAFWQGGFVRKLSVNKQDGIEIILKRM
jgi:hypothetical protein